jgi:hypothetical protein
VRILIFHGYLLSGTGSNVYNAALAEAFVRGGHEVHLLCQDRDPLALAWVDAAGDWDGPSRTSSPRRSTATSMPTWPPCASSPRSLSPTSRSPTTW